MADLKLLVAALSKLENLDKIRESLQTVSGVLSQLVSVENSSQATKSSQKSGDGGSAYVA